MRYHRCPECGALAGGPELAAHRTFTCEASDNARWNAFVGQWASVAYDLVLDATGPFDREPDSVIERAPEQNYQHSGFTGMYLEGQIYLHPSLQDDPGKTVLLMTHEMLHASLQDFPPEETFYVEGFADYATMLLALRDEWGPMAQDIRWASKKLVEFRKGQALKCRCDTDAKRWAGFVFAGAAYGPDILSALKISKTLNPRSWWLPKTPAERQNCSGPYKSCPK